MLGRSSIPTDLLGPDHDAALAAAVTSIHRTMKGWTSGSVASRAASASRCPASRSVTTCLCAARTVMG